jgi:hypothetical protein
MQRRIIGLIITLALGLPAVLIAAAVSLPEGPSHRYPYKTRHTMGPSGKQRALGYVEGQNILSRFSSVFPLYLTSSHCVVWAM